MAGNEPTSVIYKQAEMNACFHLLVGTTIGLQATTFCHAQEIKLNEANFSQIQTNKIMTP